MFLVSKMGYACCDIISLKHGQQRGFSSTAWPEKKIAWQFGVKEVQNSGAFVYNSALLGQYFEGGD
jgi:hypothetical protein